MGSNTFGQLFKMTTWGESHGKAIGVVIDGCPAGIPLNEEMINREMALRAPGKSPYTTLRKEQDKAEIYSGVFEGKTTAAPISIIIPNNDADSKPYEPIKNLYRPGHANFTYLEKYGVFDHKGGGRASARETACRVAAGAVAKQLLSHYGIETFAYLYQVKDVRCTLDLNEISKENVLESPIFCPDSDTEKKIIELIQTVKEQGDSLGGIVTFVARGVSSGLGDPVYEKLEANLAKAMMSIPASKGFEIGRGFYSVEMQGSEHNDPFCSSDEGVKTDKNDAGGTLGGISNGMPIYGRVAFKPTSSIMKSQKTVSDQGIETEFQLPKGARHDPCVAIRAVPVVEAMLAIVLADAILMNQTSILPTNLKKTLSDNATRHI